MSGDNTQGGRWPPKRCDMPNLSGFSSNLTVEYFANRTLRNVGLEIPFPGRAFFLNLTRLADKTLYEYEEARKYLQRYVHSGNETTLFFRCVGHMENCVDSLHRIFQHTNRLQHHLHTLEEENHTGHPAPIISRNELPKSKDRARVAKIRRAIQHMDDDISKEKAGRNLAPIGLIVNSDSIELGGTEISHEDLASWIKQVHKATQRLIEYDSLPE